MFAVKCRCRRDSALEETWGPFESREGAEQCVIALAASGSVTSARVEPPPGYSSCVADILENYNPSQCRDSQGKFTPKGKQNNRCLFCEGEMQWFPCTGGDDYNDSYGRCRKCGYRTPNSSITIDARDYHAEICRLVEEGERAEALRDELARICRHKNKLWDFVKAVSDEEVMHKAKAGGWPEDPEPREPLIEYYSRVAGCVLESLEIGDDE